MVPLDELRQQMLARMRELQPALDAGAHYLLERGDLEQGLAALTPVCRPDGMLDPMRVHAAMGHLIGFTVEFVDLGKPSQRQALIAQVSTRPGPADAALYLRAIEVARTLYLGQGDLDGENSVAVCDDLMDRHDEAETRWRALLEDWNEHALELLACRYAFALALFMQHRYLEAMAEFKACRAVYPRYRDTLFFLDWIRHVLPRGNVPFDPVSIALPIPRYSVVQALGRPRS